MSGKRGSMQSANVPPEGMDYWQDEDADYPTADWEHEVHDGNTRLGYWEWAFAARRCDSDTEGQPESA